MSESLVNYKIGHEKQILMLGTERVVGAQSVSIQQNLGLSPLSYIGIGNKALNFVPRSEQFATASINSYLINKDYFFTLTTGNFLSNLYIIRDKTDLSTVYTMASGYFNQFNCNYQIGNVPEVNVNFVAIRDVGIINTGTLPSDCLSQLTGISASNIDVTGSLLIPYGNSISLDINSLTTTNRVQSFNLQINSNKTPIYNIGSKFPKRIELLNSDVSLNLSFELGDYECQRLRNFSQNNIVRNLTLAINDYSTNQQICLYYLPNLTLINEEYSNTVNGFVTINQTYSTKLYA